MPTDEDVEDVALCSAEMSLADVIERMFAEFEPQLSKGTIVPVVRQCRDELELLASPLPTATLESMARQRLSHLVRLDPATPDLG